MRIKPAYFLHICGSKNNGRIPQICQKITNSLITSSLHTFNPPPPLTPNDIDLERGNLIGQLEVYLAYVYCICFGPHYADFCLCDRRGRKFAYMRRICNRPNSTLCEIFANAWKL